MKRIPYPIDLTDGEREILEPLIPARKRGGWPRTVNMREVLNAIINVLKTGCHWGLSGAGNLFSTTESNKISLCRVKECDQNGN
ncbi:MAG: transposase [Chloroflexi bacterium]|nr:transposase [Chloroflexota bacterium]